MVHHHETAPGLGAAGDFALGFGSAHTGRRPRRRPDRPAVSGSGRPWLADCDGPLARWCHPGADRLAARDGDSRRQPSRRRGRHQRPAADRHPAPPAGARDRPAGRLMGARTGRHRHVQPAACGAGGLAAGKSRPVGHRRGRSVAARGDLRRAGPAPADRRDRRDALARPRGGQAGPAFPGPVQRPDRPRLRGRGRADALHRLRLPA